jgi:hypothetical protein
MRRKRGEKREETRGKRQEGRDKREETRGKRQEGRRRDWAEYLSYGHEY